MYLLGIHLDISFKFQTLNKCFYFEFVSYEIRENIDTLETISMITAASFQRMCSYNSNYLICISRLNSKHGEK